MHLNKDNCISGVKNEFDSDHLHYDLFSLENSSKPEQKVIDSPDESLKESAQSSESNSVKISNTSSEKSQQEVEINTHLASSQDQENMKPEDNAINDTDSLKAEDDPDFLYKMPKQKFEYNKRKDVIFKTILRKCRRSLQDKFNDLTGYFGNKMLGPQFLKDSILAFHNSINSIPSKLDLIFYLGALLYPQEMSRGVDCFFESDKKDRVKLRKVYRAKIQKVHDVLYRYSHEKMDYFIKVPEL